MFDGIFDKICLVMGIIMLFMGIEIYIQHLKILNYETKEASTRQIGEVQNRRAKEEDAHSKESKSVTEEEYAKVITNMHLDTERLRQQLANSSKLPKSTTVCTSASERAEINWPDITAAIDRYRQRVGGLVKQGDQATADLNAIKMWVAKETIER